MSPLLGLFLCTTLGLGPDAEPQPPDLPGDGAEEPKESDEPEASREDPMVPDAQPTTAATEPATASTEPAVAFDAEQAPTAPRRSPEAGDDVDEKKVRTRENGDWGMTFTFGGLAPMSIAGINDFTVNRLLFSELGFRRAFERIVIPFSVGAGFFSHRPEGSGRLGDVGLAASVAVLADFRRGRRVIPHAGGAFHLHYVDPSGPSNWLINLSFGPVIGIEYFFANRVSLLLQGKLNVGFNILDGLTQVDFGTIIAAGGQMGLSFYF